MSFLGTNVSVTEVTLSSGGSGPRLGFSLNFHDADGRVHATTHHSLDPTTEPKLHAALAPLLDAIKSFAKIVHFGDTAEVAEKAPNGIFESLSASDDASDDVGQQG